MKASLKFHQDQKPHSTPKSHSASWACHFSAESSPASPRSSLSMQVSSSNPGHPLRSRSTPTICGTHSCSWLTVRLEQNNMALNLKLDADKN